MNTLNTTNKTKLSTGLKFGYGLGSMGENLAYNVFYTYFLVFMTNYAGVNAAIAGTIALVAVLWDGVIGILAGYATDHSKNPGGRRRPFMMRFAVPFGIMCCLTFTDIGLTGAAQIIWFIVMNIGFWLFFELTDVPYLTMGGELTDDPDEKTSLRSWATMLNYVGFLIASGFTLKFVGFFGGIFGNDTKGWTATCALFGLIIAITYFIVCFVTKEKDTVYDEQESKDKESSEGISMISAIIATLKIKPYRSLWLYNVIYNCSIFSCTATLVYVIMYVCGGNDNHISLIFSVYAVMVIVLSPVVTKISNSIGTRKVLLIGTVAAGAVMASFEILPLNLGTIYIMMLALASGMAGYFVLSYSALYQVVDVAPAKLGFKNDGMMVAFYQFGQKFGGALGMWLSGVLLNLFKYDPDNVTQYTVGGIRLITTAVPGLIIIVAFIVLLTFKLKKKDYDKLVQIGEKEKELQTEEEKEYVDQIL